MGKVVKIKSLSGITLNTKDKFVDDNITIIPALPVYQGEEESKLYSEVDLILTRKITSYSNTTLQEVGGYAFAGCSKLTELYLPKATKISSYGIQSTKVKKLHLPEVKTIGSNGIYQNFELEELRLDNINSLVSGAIRGSVKLIKLIITNPSVVCKAEASNVFAECYHLSGTVHATYNPEGLQDGRIYVPDHLVEEYKVASYWSAFANIIVPLSELGEVL